MRLGRGLQGLGKAKVRLGQCFFFVPIRHNICAYDHLRIWGKCGDHLSDLGAAGAQMVPLKRRRRLQAVGEGFRARAPKARSGACKSAVGAM